MFLSYLKPMFDYLKQSFTLRKRTLLGKQLLSGHEHLLGHENMAKYLVFVCNFARAMVCLLCYFVVETLKDCVTLVESFKELP